MNKQKIGFWGGCFNPPSNAHIDLAQKILKDLNLNKIIFVPVGDYYEKENLVDSVHRYNMLKLATEEVEGLEVEDIEIKSKVKLYAKDAFAMLKEKYFEDEVYFIMGSDNFIKMPAWKDYDNIIKNYRYIVIRRLGFDMITTRSNVIYYEPVQTKDISSTKIREHLKYGENLSDYLNENVYKYIRNNNLYDT